MCLRVFKTSPSIAHWAGRILSVGTLLCSGATLGANQSDTVRLNADWRFSADRQRAAQFPETPDQEWESVNLPHTPPAIDHSRGAPFLRDRTRPCWYRRHVSLSQNHADKRVYLHFEHIDTKFRLWINGHPLEAPPPDQSTFEYDITRRFNFGDHADNVLAIQNFSALSQNHKFPGSESKSAIWLRVRHPIHLLDEELTIAGPVIDDSVARVRVDGRIVNEQTEAAEITLVSQVIDPLGEIVGKTQIDLHVPAGASAPVSSDLIFPVGRDAGSIEANGFGVVVQVLQSGEIIDRFEITRPGGSSPFRDQTNRGIPLTAN